MFDSSPQIKIKYNNNKIKNFKQCYLFADTRTLAYGILNFSSLNPTPTKMFDVFQICPQ